ncbi:hypothetical protein ACKGJY_00085 [Hyunsoonleella sp. 2307UL5-6]|uniref:hypothetical protein n=1 Tax=Hyunsoonleella sp. 2307UL5-6 TaxID=3384768 RepID=UPI0039BC7D16
MKNKYIVFLVLAILSLGLNFLSKGLLNTDELIINSLADNFTNEQIQEALNIKNKWQLVIYISIPLVLLLKVLIVATIISTGCFFFDKEIKYKTIFRIVVEAEFIFLLVIVCKTLWFYLFQTNYTLEDLQYFYPLSSINLTGYDNLKPWFVYPLQVLNLFEVAYWFILAYLLGKEFKEGIFKGLTVVASSYGVGLVIWVVAVMFFTLNMS